ncbi:MAG: hypoxanthine phosphoribosyltransferase [Chitinophagales bacterium]|nr:hypoxanthine phosphoribosyltransferase [Chitinophagales bacterium]
MDVVRVNDLEFRSYISNEMIQTRVKEIAQRINADLKNESPLFIGILNGSFMFAADLMKEVTIKSEITFVKLASYSGTESTGEVLTRIGLEKSVTGRTIVIVEDIIDSGKTIFEMLEILKKQKPARVIIATLLLKPAALLYKFNVEYIGFEVPNDFLVGYGLDYDGLGRNLKDIYVKV